MILKKYNKLEALKNKCLPISFEKALALIIIYGLLFTTLFIFSPFILPFSLNAFLEILIILLILIGIPFFGCLLYFHNIKWFSTAFIVKNEKIYLVQLINYDLIQEKYQDINVVNPPWDLISSDESYLNMLNNFLLQKKIDGKVVLLDNLMLLKETNKYYKCSYTDKNKKYKLNIPKSYINFLEIIKEVYNEQ